VAPVPHPVAQSRSGPWSRVCSFSSDIIQRLCNRRAYQTRSVRTSARVRRTIKSAAVKSSNAAPPAIFSSSARRRQFCCRIDLEVSLIAGSSTSATNNRGQVCSRSPARSGCRKAPVPSVAERRTHICVRRGNNDRIGIELPRCIHLADKILVSVRGRASLDAATATSDSRRTNSTQRRKVFRSKAANARWVRSRCPSQSCRCFRLLYYNRGLGEGQCGELKTNPLR